MPDAPDDPNEVANGLLRETRALVDRERELRRGLRERLAGADLAAFDEYLAAADAVWKTFTAGLKSLQDAAAAETRALRADLTELREEQGQLEGELNAETSEG